MITSSFPCSPGQRLTTLFVSPLDSEHAGLRRIFDRSNWDLRSAFSCEDALSILDREAVPVVICDSDLPDGSWRAVLESAHAMKVPPRVIVSSRGVSEHLWASVLQSGGYDLLASPWDAREVLRVIALAWRSWEFAHRTENRLSCLAPSGSRSRAATAVIA